MPLNAIHITAKAMRPLLEVESATTFSYWVDPIPANKNFHLRQSTNLVTGFEAMDPAQPIHNPSAAESSHQSDQHVRILSDL